MKYIFSLILILLMAANVYGAHSPADTYWQNFFAIEKQPFPITINSPIVLTSADTALVVCCLGLIADTATSYYETAYLTYSVNGDASCASGMIQLDSTGVYQIGIWLLDAGSPEMHIIGQTVVFPTIAEYVTALTSNLATLSEVGDSVWNNTLAQDIIDSLNAVIDSLQNPDRYHADVSGLSTFDYTTDKVTMVDSSAGDLSLIANNPDNYKSDVSGLSMFDPTDSNDSGSIADIVAQVATDSSDLYQGPGSSLTAADIYAEFTADSNENAFKADVSGLPDSSVVYGAVVQVLEDSTSKYQGDAAGVDSSVVYGAVVQVLEDSTSKYQGEAGSLDSATVYGATKQAMVDTAQAIVDAFAGSNYNPCYFYTLDETDSSAVDQCWIRIYNSGMTSTMNYWRTDPNGLLVASLIDGSYKIVPNKSGYKFSGIPYSVSVNGGVTDTFFCAAFNPQAPTDPDLCNVWGDFGGMMGTAHENIKIKITSDTRVLKAPDGRIIINLEEEIESDSLGHWEVPLYPNSILNPSDSKYIFVFRIGRDEWKRENIIIPDQDTWEFDW